MKVGQQMANSPVAAALALDGAQECFTGVSAYLTQLKEFVSAQAWQRGPLLLVSERGLRPLQVARAIHLAGGQAPETFQTVKLRAHSPEELHELFCAPQGLLNSHTPGTVFVDDLASLPVPLWRRCALFLEEQRWRPASGGLRLVFTALAEPGADTRGDSWDELLRPGLFRLKPLRERSEDLPELIQWLTQRLVQRLARGAVLIPPATLKLLSAYNWPENLDELEAVLESVIQHLPPATLNEELLPQRIRFTGFQRLPAEGISLWEAVEQFEKTLIATALQQTGGVQTRAAQLLGLCPQTLNMKLKRLGGPVKSAA